MLVWVIVLWRGWLMVIVAWVGAGVVVAWVGYGIAWVGVGVGVGDGVVAWLVDGGCGVGEWWWWRG